MAEAGLPEPIAFDDALSAYPVLPPIRGRRRVSAATETDARGRGLGALVMRGLIWRSGSQIVAQLFTWAATFLVIRILQPGDYGLFAMTQTVLFLLSMLSGASFASVLVRQPTITRHDIAQTFGLLILLNGGLAIIQFAVAPLVAAYYRQPVVADLLRVQCLIYAANPFLALAGALLSREMEFRRQAIANFVSAFVGAGTAIGGAWAGWGVWTLVAAPIAAFWARAVGLAIAARLDVAPVFRFRGAGETIRYGLAMITSSLFWFVQTQCDVFIGGRAFDPHDLGLYTTALFLAQIFTAKFVPPMNEVAFSAYARLQHDPAALGAAFARAAGLIFVVALPFYAGMAITAEPLVITMLGPKWAGTVEPVRWLALAMPFVTIQILFAPATNAIGRPRLAVWGSVCGAIIMPVAFALAVQGGPAGMAKAWIFAFPLLTLITAAISLPALGLRPRDLLGALRAPVLATLGMAAVLLPFDMLLPPAMPLVRLALLVIVGILAYAGFAWLLARDAVRALIALLRGRGPQPA